MGGRGFFFVGTAVRGTAVVEIVLGIGFFELMDEFSIEFCPFTRGDVLFSLDGEALPIRQFTFWHGSVSGRGDAATWAASVIDRNSVKMWVVVQMPRQRLLRLERGTRTSRMTTWDISTLCFFMVCKIAQCLRDFVCIQMRGFF